MHPEDKPCIRLLIHIAWKISTHSESRCSLPPQRASINSLAPIGDVRTYYFHYAEFFLLYSSLVGFFFL
jgi:hypothetical protein